MNYAEFDNQMRIVVMALWEQGYDPYAQLSGYLQYDDPSYITRNRNARILVQKLDKEQIRQFLINHYK